MYAAHTINVVTERRKSCKMLRSLLSWAITLPKFFLDQSNGTNKMLRAGERRCFPVMQPTVPEPKSSWTQPINIQLIFLNPSCLWENRHTFIKTVHVSLIISVGKLYQIYFISQKLNAITFILESANKTFTLYYHYILFLNVFFFTPSNGLKLYSQRSPIVLSLFLFHPHY